MAEKKESSSARRRRLSKERTARRKALKAQGAKNTKTVISGLKEMLFGKKKKPKPAQKALPPGKKGGPLAKKTKALPPGKKGGPLAKVPKQLKGAKGPKGLLKGAGRGLGGKLGAAGLVLGGAATAKDLADSLGRGEGYAKIFKKGTTQGKGTKGGQGGSRAKVTRKVDTKKDKPKVTKRNRRGRPVAYAAPVKPARRGMSNIPPGEGTGKGSPNDKKKPTVKKPTRVTKKVSGTSASKGTNKGRVAPSKPAKKGKNAYRAPQGSERKDKSYKAVQELRGMIKGSKARQNAQMPKKPVKKKISRNELNRRRRQGR